VYGHERGIGKMGEILSIHHWQFYSMDRAVLPPWRDTLSIIVTNTLYLLMLRFLSRLLKPGPAAEFILFCDSFFPRDNLGTIHPIRSVTNQCPNQNRRSAWRSSATQSRPASASSSSRGQCDLVTSRARGWFGDLAIVPRFAT
jgi:hypothetical protein